MRNRAAIGVLLGVIAAQGLLQILPEASAQQGLTIEHQPGCMPTGMHPVLRAKIAVAGVAQARVYFRASEQAFWTWVPMARDAANADTWKATLPKPLPDTKQVQYYVQAVGADAAEDRTQRFTAHVEPLGRGCTASPGTYVETASVGVGSDEADLKVAGLTGFDGRGIRDLTPHPASPETQDGGSGSKKILLLGGALAVAGGAALAAGGGSAKPPGPVATTTPPPSPSPEMNLAGHWAGVGAPDGIEVTQNADCELESNMDMTLSQTGPSLAGRGTSTIRKANPERTDCSPPGTESQFTLMGMVDSPTTVSFTIMWAEFTARFTGTFTNTRMSGTWECQGCPRNGTWAVNKQ